jgi:hypothetical protein
MTEITELEQGESDFKLKLRPVQILKVGEQKFIIFGMLLTDMPQKEQDHLLKLEKEQLAIEQSKAT